MNPDSQKIDEIHKLTRENNKMLHAMRRNAFLGGILKLIIYGIFLLAPIWFYMTYLNASVQQMMHTLDQIQGTGTQAQVKLNSFEKTWQDLQAKLPSFMQSSSTVK